MARTTIADLEAQIASMAATVNTLAAVVVAGNTAADEAPKAAKASKASKASHVSEKLPALSRWDNGVKAGNTFTYTPKREGASARDYVAISEAEAVAYVKACIAAGYTFALPAPDA